MTRWAAVGSIVGVIVLTAAACSSSDDGSGVVPATVSERATTSTPLEPDPSTTTPDAAPVESTTEPVAATLRGLYDVEVVSIRDHDETAYTQGLELHDGLLLESTGLRGVSDRRWVDPETGVVMERQPLDDSLFGEGITVVDDRVLQLTYQSGVLLIADADSLTVVDTLNYDGEGWGLCELDGVLIMSNGTAEVVLRDPVTFAPIGAIEVVDGTETPVANLNELECVNGQVLANIYGSDQIAVFDPATGAVQAVIDASSLRPPDAPADDLDYALNGIAFDSATGHYYLTGKLWPVLYEVELVPAGS